jgi:DNA-binding CsgD family transcriptional regulator
MTVVIGGAELSTMGHGSVPDLGKALSGLAAATSDKQSARGYSLTLPELQIVEPIVAGFTNKGIAQKFSISEQTVKHHLSNVFDKLGGSNCLELAPFIVHHNMIPDPWPKPTGAASRDFSPRFSASAGGPEGRGFSRAAGAGERGRRGRGPQSHGWRRGL